MKIKMCPKCGEYDLGEQWTSGRKLVQYCRNSECNWESNPRTPEKLRIANTKTCYLDESAGWDYILYDKYGGIIIISGKYAFEKQAKAEMQKSLDMSVKDGLAGPYTGVLFHTPVTIKIAGKVFKAKRKI